MTRLGERRGSDLNLRSEPQMREYRAIAESIAADRPKRVLDWGCGWGQVTTMMRERGLEVVPYEYRPDVETEGFQPLELHPEIGVYVSADPVKLPFASNSFDAVLSLGVLEHVSDPDGSLEELRRVLEPGGRLYVYKLPNRYSYLEKLAKLLGLYYHGQFPDDTVYTKRSAAALLEAHGFEVERLRRANLLPLTLQGRLATRAAGPIWAVNRALARVPGLNVLATNVELIATAR